MLEQKKPHTLPCVSLPPFPHRVVLQDIFHEGHMSAAITFFPLGNVSSISRPRRLVC